MDTRTKPRIHILIIFKYFYLDIFDMAIAVSVKIYQSSFKKKRCTDETEAVHFFFTLNNYITRFSVI